MLTSFRVDNFKSLINGVFEPAGLNLLVGPNNAGKTNLCQALRFLSLTASMPLAEAAGTCHAEPWNVLNVYIAKETVTLGVTCSLTLGQETLTFRYELNLLARKALQSQTRVSALEVTSEVLRVSGGRFVDQVLLENTGGRVRLLHETRFLKGLTAGSEPAYVETVAPGETTMLNRLYDLETNQRSNLFKRYLSSWGYYNLEPNRLRNNQGRPLGRVLDSNGSNLSAVLFTLHNVAPRIERALIEATRQVEPRLDLFSFEAPDPEHVYMFVEDRQGHRFGLDNVSDGTLRYMALCYLTLAGRETAKEGAPPVVIVEEPENGIFVGYLKDVFDKVEPSGREGQFIFTSQNPYFIDLFDAALEGLFVIKSGETHSTLVRPDPAKLQELLGKFSLGEMQFRGLLE